MNTKITKAYYQNDYKELPVLNHLTYRNQLTDPINSTDPKVNFEVQRNFFLVSSAMRDKTLYPDPASFKITLPTVYRDIVSMELYGGVLPNLNGIALDAYLLLDMGSELNHILGADNNQWFAILGLNRHTNSLFMNLDKTNTDDVPIVFKPPKDKLTHFELKLKHPDGSAVSFGTESSGTPSNMDIQVTYLFEIKTKVPQRIGLDRNIRSPII